MGSGGLVVGRDGGREGKFTLIDFTVMKRRWFQEFLYKRLASLNQCKFS